MSPESRPVALITGCSYKAAASPAPDDRYVVGWDARLAILVDRLLPARATQWLYERLA